MIQKPKGFDEWSHFFFAGMSAVFALYNLPLQRWEALAVWIVLFFLETFALYRSQSKRKG